MSVEPRRKKHSSQNEAVPKVGAIDDIKSKTNQDTTVSTQTLREQIQAQFQNLAGQKQTKKGSSKPPKDLANLPPTTVPDNARGKKRDRNGTVLRQAKIQQDDSVNSHASVQEDDDLLLEEIKALGGTAQDLELFAGAESESEIEGEGQKKSQKSQDKAGDVQKGISNILKEIALSQGAGSNSQDSSSDSDNEVDQKQDQTHTALSSTTQTQDVSRIKKKDSLLKCEPRPDWFNLADDLSKPTTNPKYTPSLATLDEIHTFARSLLEQENTNYRKAQQSSSQSFYNTVITSGTLSDKISALTLAVQESPLHNVKALETLIGLSQKRNRSQAVDVLRALKDLLAQGTLLPGDRRLYTFATHPAMLTGFGTTKTWKEGDHLPKGVREEHLICWAFESWLKEQYFEVLQTLEVWCNDEIEFSKARAISYVYELLKEKPEQESNLLRLLINKLGDPMKKIASQTSYLLMQLLGAHPAMKSIVISAIESDFIFKPGQSLHGKYYAVVTINQTALSSKEEDVAIKLLDIYFGIFTSLLNSSNDRNIKPNNTDEAKPQPGRDKKVALSGEAQSEELREKLTSAILTGVNRAYPYAGSDSRNFEQHLETLFKIAHSVNFNTSIQALLLIQQLSSSHQPSSDRFYRTLYESLLDPRLVHASKQQMYLNLLHRALKADLNMKRVKAFIKRLLQVLVLHEPSFICGVFFLLKDLEKSFPALTALVDTVEDHDNNEEVFRDVLDEEDEETAVAPLSGTEPASTLYDAHKRAPEHANADNSCAWEVLPFLAHFHPSVSVSADSYLRHTKLPGKADLSLHTLIHFLDRFVYRNAKLSDTKLRGSSIMQPMATDNAHATLINRTTGGLQRLAVNSESFRQKKGTEVAAEDVFFHNYFNSMGKEQTQKGKKKKRDGKIGNLGDEDAVWKAMMDSAPDLEGADSDDDLSMSDLDSASHADTEDDIEGVYGSDEEDVDGEGVDIEPGIFDESDDDLIAIDEEDETTVLDDNDSEDEVVIDEAPKGDKTSKKSREQRKKMKALPIFASAADYAKMLGDEEDEDLG